MFHIHFTLKVNIENLENELPFYIILKIDTQDMEGKKDRKDFKQAQLVRGNYRIHSNVVFCTPWAQKRQAQSDKDEEHQTSRGKAQHLQPWLYWYLMYCTLNLS